jgi:hypothetical protein
MVRFPRHLFVSGQQQICGKINDRARFVARPWPGGDVTP